MLDQLNTIRRNAGLPELVPNDQLANAANRHVADLASGRVDLNDSHHGSDGSTAVTRVQQAGYPLEYVQEMTGWGFDGNDDRMVEYWMESPVHRPIILAPDLYDVGVVETYRPGSAWGTYWTVLLGRKAGAVAPEPAPEPCPEPKPPTYTVNVPVVAGGSHIDLLRFLQGDHGRQFDMGHNIGGGGTQTVQVWHLDADNWLYVKGNQNEYEKLGRRSWSGTEWVFRFEDTSESPSRFYAHYMSEGGAIGAPWLPRYAAVGKWYTTGKFVQHYLKDGCVKQNSGNVYDRLRVLSGPRPVTYPESGATLQEVITVEWTGGEQYDFAAGRGCVAFRDEDRAFWFIGDLQGRPDKPFDKPGCLNLGW